MVKEKIIPKEVIPYKVGGLTVVGGLVGITFHCAPSSGLFTVHTFHKMHLKAWRYIIAFKSESFEIKTLYASAAQLHNGGS
jgi:hypothetical protein